MQRNKDVFVGREAELKKLKKLVEKKTASIAVITGRRRIGKSRLVREFTKGKKHYVFSGIPPLEQTTAEDQRREFAKQFAQQFDLYEPHFDDWSEYFQLLAKHTSNSKLVIFFDEISWMGSKDHNFLGKLKTAWDLHFSKNPNLILILCGSVSSWIEKNILSSTGFVGRITAKISLEELNLKECGEFFDKVGFQASAFERLTYLSVVGGVPWYLELLNHEDSVNENIKNLCFTKDGILVDEFDRIFNDLFGKRNEIYKKIVEHLTKGPLEFDDIAEILSYSNSGTLSEYLDELNQSGFISRDYTWSLKTGQLSRLSQFRLSDNYLRFYFRFILPNMNKIKKNQFSEMSISSLVGWNSVIGLQFENLVLNNHLLLLEELGIKAEDVIISNPFFQRKTSKQEACQIDYLIQTKYKTLYLCEVKFSQNEIKTSVINEVQEKIKRMRLPKGLAVCPVLIHAGDVSDKVYESEYFKKIIDFCELLS